MPMQQERETRAREGKRQWERRLLGDLADAERFAAIAKKLASPFQQSDIALVGAFEALGFPLGARVAQILQAGLICVRKAANADACDDFEAQQFEDYDGELRTFKVLSSSVAPQARVLIVDDYLETGAQLKAGIYLMERLGAVVVGATFMGVAKRSDIDLSDLAGYNIYELGRKIDIGIPFTHQ
jgi:adenine/guanine phosphoribosyltransferase-like PRPP-binding protein